MTMSPWRIARLSMFCLLGTLLLATATLPGELSWQERAVVAAIAVLIAAVGVMLEYVDRFAEWMERKANRRGPLDVTLKFRRKERGV